MSVIALGFIKLYQNTLSRVMPSVCRYQPTCSQYAYEAIKKHGFGRGTLLATRRVLRCNPFTEGGYDPVP